MFSNYPNTRRCEEASEDEGSRKLQSDEDTDSVDEDEDPDRIEIPGVFHLANPALLLFNKYDGQGPSSSQNSLKLENSGSKWSHHPQNSLKSVSNMWSGENTKEKLEADLDVEQDEDLGVADTYDNYFPSKLSIGTKHPDLVIETASLASVFPPDIRYKLSLPHSTMKSRALSALQLEAIVYACQQHQFYLENGDRAGYLIGDGAGVGKGRTLAGIIYENYVRGRKKSIWISVSSDLKYDAERDLADIGADIPVHPLNKIRYRTIDDIDQGIIFSTYSSLISYSKQDPEFTRLKQLTNWCGDNFKGVIIFDECHRAKNLLGNSSGANKSKTGAYVAELQKLLPKARVVYSSATGASEPKDMAYMSRLGIWGRGTPFKDFTKFTEAIELRGIGAMEIIAMDMKLRGSYIARQLSFSGVKFTIKEAFLTPRDVLIYDESVKLWVEIREAFKEAESRLSIEGSLIWPMFWSAHQRFFKYLCIAYKVPIALQTARESVKDGKCVVIALQSTGEARTLEQLDKDEGELTDFVSTAKGVLESLIEKHFPISNVNYGELREGSCDTFKNIMKEIRPDHQSTKIGPKRKKDRKSKVIPQKKKNFTTISDSSSSESSDGSSSDTSSNNDKESTTSPTKCLLRLKQDLLAKIERLGKKLPSNTLDHLINELGGPDYVAELTGRKGRVIQTDAGEINYETRAESDASAEAINRVEKERFLSGEKLFAIISEAASCGISLHSDRRFQNRRRRVHIILELPWSADRAIQQFGRTHRSNQVNAPEYVLLISNLAGEHRFASIVAKRLESLGALTHGDRRATGPRDFSRFNIDNRFGRQALNVIMKCFLADKKTKMVKKPLEKDSGNSHHTAAASEDVSMKANIRNALVGVGLIHRVGKVYMLDKECTHMTKFLNRILGMPVMLQNTLFQWFLDTLDDVVAKAKKSKQFDMGILDLCEGEVKCKSTAKFVRKHATGFGLIELHKLQVEKGMSWKESLEKYEQLVGKYAAYYLSIQGKNGSHMAFLVTADPSSQNFRDKKDSKPTQYCLHKPNTGLLYRRVTLDEILIKNRRVESQEAAKHWQQQYEASMTLCSHVFWQGKCYKNADVCEVGFRVKTYNVLSGAVLLVWNEVEALLGSQADTVKMQIVRVKSGDAKFVGLLIPNCFAEKLMKKLGNYKQDG